MGQDKEDYTPLEASLGAIREEILVSKYIDTQNVPEMPQNELMPPTPPPIPSPEPEHKEVKEEVPEIKMEDIIQEEQVVFKHTPPQRKTREEELLQMVSMCVYEMIINGMSPVDYLTGMLRACEFKEGHSKERLENVRQLLRELEAYIENKGAYEEEPQSRSFFGRLRKEKK